MFPLESAEQNIRRLTFDMTIILPLPEADPTNEIQQRIVQCSECGAKFCSSECLAKAESIYHKIMCNASRPGQAFDQVNEIWKWVEFLVKS